MKLQQITKKLIKASNIFVVLILSVVLVASAQPALFALSIQEREALQTPFYDPDSAFSGACSPYGGIGLVGNENGEKIWTYFINRGLTPEQTAGIMGNLFQESGYLPHKQERFNNQSVAASFNSDRGGWGIAQWSFGRRTSLKNTVLEELGSGYYTYEELDEGRNDELLLLQLEYVYEEMQVRRVDAAVSDTSLRGMTEWEAIQLMTTIEDALVFFHDSFERSADTEQEVINRRGGFAQAAFSEYGGSIFSPFTDSACGDFVGGNLQELTLSYAWPDYRGSTYSTQKPEYTAAIERARENGETWFGGCGGNDCGAFVTRIIRDSGFDRGYNPENCNTTCQMRYLESSWTNIGRGNEINTADLRPGDVAIRVSRPGETFGHTFVFVGDIPGFDSQIASASVDSNCSNSRAPMAGRESLTDSTMTWFRKP